MSKKLTDKQARKQFILDNLVLPDKFLTKTDGLLLAPYRGATTRVIQANWLPFTELKKLILKHKITNRIEYQLAKKNGLLPDNTPSEAGSCKSVYKTEWPGFDVFFNRPFSFTNREWYTFKELKKLCQDLDITTYPQYTAARKNGLLSAKAPGNPATIYSKEWLGFHHFFGTESDQTFTIAEDKFLKKYYPTNGYEYIMQKLNKTKNQVKSRVSTLKIKRTRWTQKDIDFLTKNYTKYGLTYCIKHLHKTKYQIGWCVTKLKLVDAPKDYTPADIKFLKLNYLKHGAAYCAEKLGRNIEALQKKARKLKMKSGPQCKAVAKTNKNGKILKKYESIKEAALDNDLDCNGIVKVCKGKQKYTQGTYWKYI